MKFPFIFLISTSFPLWAGDAKSPITPPAKSGNWQWSISAGTGYRNVGHLNIYAGYRSKNTPLPSFVGSDSLVVPPIGSPSTYGERFYNDGYVRQDASTDTDGLTQYWGYQNASQVQSDQLIYSATGYESIRSNFYSVPNTGPYSRDSLRGFSPHLQIDGRSPFKLGAFTLGFSGGFDFTRVSQGMVFSNWSDTQIRDDYRDDYQDRYNLNGVIPPAAPYMGDFAGPGPLIGNLPNSRSRTPTLLFTDIAELSNTVFNNMGIDVFSFTFGPTLSHSWGALNVSVQAGLIFNIYNWDTRQSERLNVTTSSGTRPYRTWAEGDSGVTFRPGLYTQAELTYAVSKLVRIGGYLRLDTASEFSAHAGPTVFKIDPSGLNIGLQVRYMLP